jgi:hypothetical protein
MDRWRHSSLGYAITASHDMITSLAPSTDISTWRVCPGSIRRKKSTPKRWPVRKDVDPPRMVTTEQLRALEADMKDPNVLRITIPTPALPLSFVNLFKALRVLDLRKVGLERLPPQIIELENLQKLDLRYNKLSYLPSQIAQLPNLHDLRLEDPRKRKSKPLKELEVSVNPDANPSPPSASSEICACSVRTDRQRIPPLPTLTQLCTRLMLSAIPTTVPNDPDVLSWEDLEPLYTTGKLDDKNSGTTQLPFPSHLLPMHISYDICSSCSEPVLPVHAQFDRIQVVALCRVLLRYVFCSHGCLSKVVAQWDRDRTEEIIRKRSREMRFHIKEGER